MPVPDTVFTGKRDETGSSWVYKGFLQESDVYALPHPFIPGIQLILTADVSHVMKGKQHLVRKNAITEV